MFHTVREVLQAKDASPKIKEKRLKEVNLEYV